LDGAFERRFSLVYGYNRIRILDEGNMRYLGWVVKILLFVMLLGFALKNSQPVTLHYFLGYVWQAPLVVLLLAAFVLGALAGVLALLPVLFRLRRERAKQHKQVDGVKETDTLSLPPADSHGI
jgi:lipopolysaccharide assembly protein A